MKTYLLTGATGFVGGAIALEMLARTDARLVCLVRGKDPVEAEQRLRATLATSAHAYGRAELIPLVRERCQALWGDMVEDGCGLEGPPPPRVDEVWHTAASLKYHDRDAKEIALHNVVGTRNVLQLARRVEAGVFNYVSTAYVAGNRRGRIAEELPADLSVTNNQYERTKIEAELLVAASEGFQTRIFRPSIVIGHGATRAATSFTGLYGFLRDLERFKRKVARKLGGFLQHRSLRVLGEASSTLNFVPVNLVAEGAVRIALSDSRARIFHLTNERLTTVDATVGMMFEALELRRPMYVQSEKAYSSLDEKLNEELEFYSSYMRHPKVFERTSTDQVLGPDFFAYPLPDEELKAFIDWYLRILLGGYKGQRGEVRAEVA